MAKGRKSFTIELAEELYEQFGDFVEQRGWKKTIAVHGALRAFMQLPLEIQVMLMSNSVPDTHNLLEEHYRDRDIREFLGSLSSPEDREAFVQAARQLIKKFRKR
jgi:hypothetical protein